MIPHWAQRYCMSGWEGTQAAIARLDPDNHDAATPAELDKLADIETDQRAITRPGSAESDWQIAMERLGTGLHLMRLAGANWRERRRVADDMAQAVQALVSTAGAEAER